MRRRARTALCGGRLAMIVPTATASYSGSNFLCQLFNGALLQRLGIGGSFGLREAAHVIDTADKIAKRR
jgi:hypothetical protein